MPFGSLARAAEAAPARSATAQRRTLLLGFSGKHVRIIIQVLPADLSAGWSDETNRLLHQFGESSQLIPRLPVLHPRLGPAHLHGPSLLCWGVSRMPTQTQTQTG